MRALEWRLARFAEKPLSKYEYERQRTLYVLFNVDYLTKSHYYIFFSVLYDVLSTVRGSTNDILCQCKIV